MWKNVQRYLRKVKCKTNYYNCCVKAQVYRRKNTTILQLEYIRNKFRVNLIYTENVYIITI